MVATWYIICAPCWTVRVICPLEAWHLVRAGAAEHHEAPEWTRRRASSVPIPEHPLVTIAVEGLDGVESSTKRTAMTGQKSLRGQEDDRGDDAAPLLARLLQLSLLVHHIHSLQYHAVLFLTSPRASSSSRLLSSFGSMPPVSGPSTWFRALRRSSDFDTMAKHDRAQFAIREQKCHRFSQRLVRSAPPSAPPRVR